MSDGFSTPKSAPQSETYFKPANHVDRDTGRGDLVLIEVTEYRTDFPGYEDKDEDRDGVKVIVTVLDGEQEGVKYEESNVHNARLIKVLKGSAGSGQPVLGRLALGQKTGKGAAPFVLTDPSAKDIEAAKKWLAANKTAPFVE